MQRYLFQKSVPEPQYSKYIKPNTLHTMVYSSLLGQNNDNECIKPKLRVPKSVDGKLNK